jgi:hypothetical protein
MPCGTGAASARRCTRCGRLWRRSEEGNHDDVRPLQRHFSLSVQRDSRTTAGTASPVLRDVRCWNGRGVWLLSSPSHEAAGLQSLRRHGAGPTALSSTRDTTRRSPKAAGGRR